MATPTKIDGAANVQLGLTGAETGIKVSTTSQDWANPKALTFDHLGTTDGFITDYDKSTSMTITGETAGSDFSTLAPNFYNRVVPANFLSNAFDLDLSGATAGLVLDTVNISMSRAPGMRTITFTYQGWEDVTLADAP